MNLKIFLLGLILMFNSLTFAQCDEISFQTSKLPKEVPADVQISYHENGGMLNAHKYISVANDVLTYEEKLANEQSPRKWTAKISKADKEKLYRTFVENKFDLIKNDKMEGVVYDAPSRGISIRFGAQSFHISNDMNSPLSGDNQTRYSFVSGAIMQLASFYTPKAENTSENYVVIPFKNWMFKNASGATLEKSEIAEVEAILKKAVNEYNAPQKESLKINLPEYKRQFVSFINDKNEKIVWVNCFVGDYFENWREALVTVDDGGNSFFNVKINLTKKIYYDFRVNGDA